MKSKKMYSLWMMAAIVAMSFTACSENVEPEKTTLEHSKMTCFGSGEVVTPAVVASVDGEWFAKNRDGCQWKIFMGRRRHCLGK